MANRNAKKTAPQIGAEICLYGSSRAGAFDFLASVPGANNETVLVPGGMDPRTGKLRYGSCTEAIYQAVIALREAGARDVLVRIYAPGGERCAEHHISEIPSFGSMAWRDAAPAVVITAEQIEELRTKLATAR